MYGTVWNDVNLNGVQDPGEPDLPDMVVELLDKNGNTIATAITHSPYEFTEIPPGTYDVKIYPGPGQVPTTPVVLQGVVTVTEGCATGPSFGVYDSDINGSVVTTLLPPDTQLTQSSEATTTSSASGSHGSTASASSASTGSQSSASTASVAKPIRGAVPAYTGSSNGALAGFGAGFIGLGAALVLTLRRRREN